MSPARRRVVAALMVAYLLTVAAIVFWPTAQVPSASVGWIYERLVSIGIPERLPSSSIEFVLNIVLFVPMSLLGFLLWQRWTWVGWTVTGLVASLGVETIQMSLLAGRSPTVADIVANTIGAYFGAQLGRVAWVYLRERPRPLRQHQP